MLLMFVQGMNCYGVQSSYFYRIRADTLLLSGLCCSVGKSILLTLFCLRADTQLGSTAHLQDHPTFQVANIVLSSIWFTELRTELQGIYTRHITADAFQQFAVNIKGQGTGHTLAIDTGNARCCVLQVVAPKAQVPLPHRLDFVTVPPEIFGNNRLSMSPRMLPGCASQTTQSYSSGKFVIS